MPYSISNHVSYDDISPQYQVFLVTLLSIVEPTTYEEVVKDLRWIGAMKAKIVALKDNHTWNVVSFPDGKVHIGCK